MGSRKTGRVRFEHAYPPYGYEYTLVTVEGYTPAPGNVTIEVPEKMVREVVKYVMDEPVLGTIVRAKVEDVERPQIFERSNDHINGAGWYQAGDDTPYTWEHVSKLGEPEIVYDPEEPDDEEDF